MRVITRIPTRRPFPRALTVICLFVVACVTAVALSGCYHKAERQESAGKDFVVETLFTKDGCTVYRFKDSDYRYFTNCSGSSEWREHTGNEGQTRAVEIPGGK